MRLIFDNGKPFTENLRPCALFGGIGKDFAEGSLRTGAHMLKATPSAAAQCKGVAGTSLKLEFSVIDSLAPARSMNLFASNLLLDGSGEAAGEDLG